MRFRPVPIASVALCDKPQQNLCSACEHTTHTAVNSANTTATQKTRNTHTQCSPFDTATRNTQSLQNPYRPIYSAPRSFEMLVRTQNTPLKEDKSSLRKTTPKAAQNRQK